MTLSHDPRSTMNLVVDRVAFGLSPFFRSSLFFFFNDPATTEIYTLSLHDALPIFPPELRPEHQNQQRAHHAVAENRDRKSTRLNSSHLGISYAVFCLKKKKKHKQKLSKYKHTQRNHN